MAAEELYQMVKTTRLLLQSKTVPYSPVSCRRQSLEAKFAELDRDGSGDLDADELVETLVYECAVKRVQARTLVDDFDLNRNGTLDKDEFMTMWFKLFR